MKTRKTIITTNDIINIENEIIACSKILNVCKPDSIRFELTINKIEELTLTRRNLIKLFDATSKSSYLL